MVTHAKKATVGNSPKNHPGKIYSSSKCVRKLIFCIFCARARSGRVPDRFRRLRRPSRIRDFQEFYDTFLLVFAILFCRLRADFVRVCRVPPKVLPGSASRRSNPFAVFFCTILFCWFLRFFFAGCVPILSGFVGFRRDFAGIRIQTQ